MTFNYTNSAADTNVPKEYLRTPDPQLLPPRVGHNWNDQAFRANQKKPQQLEAEFRGKRYFTSEGKFDNPPPAQMGQTAAQLLASMSAKNRSRVAKKEETPFMTLDDKVLNFNAFFCEKAPQGGASDMWQRRVVIYFYPADNTILIQEPHIPNSGLDGGTFLKRQKVKADPRQRELFPDDEFLTINLFNVGEWVRINSIEFFLYDCDAFTREFLTMLGVDVGPSVEPPDDTFFLSKRNTNLAKSGTNYTPKDNQTDEAERAARFIQDGGKLLRFYALLDERNGPKACVRKLEVLLYVEDNTIAVVEKPTAGEATPVLFLSRTWLPKSGSVSKQNELTFSHRVDGQREPYVGPDAYYKETDLSVGMTLNVLGRSVLLYDCDDFTREFYKERYGYEQPPATDVSEYFAPTEKDKMLKEARETSRALALAASGKGQAKSMAHTSKEVLRFRLKLANPQDHDNSRRRFVLTFYTGADEGMLYEVAMPNLNYPAGCLLKRQPLAKPAAQGSLRTVGGATANTNQQLIKEVDRYREADIGVGKELMIAGLLLTIVGMDAHTEAYYLGKPAALPSEEVIKRLLAALLDFCFSRYGTAVKTFLAMDSDKDGVVSVDEFTAVVKQFQITDDSLVAHVLFEHIASAPDTAFLTTEDVMKWMSDKKSEGLRRQKVEATLGTKGEEQKEHIKNRGLRTKALLMLRERLEARRIHSVDMFRMASTMPRAYREKRADIHSLTNPTKDAVITPVQLRRCLDEILGGYPTDEQMLYILGFFFPTMPEDQHLRQQDVSMDYSVSLPEFQAKFNEITKLSMLPE